MKLNGNLAVSGTLNVSDSNGFVRRSDGTGASQPIYSKEVILASTAQYISIDVPNIGSGLIIDFWGRTTHASAFQPVFLRMNGDTGSNYDCAFCQRSGGDAFVAVSEDGRAKSYIVAPTWLPHAAATPATAYGAGRIHIPDHTNTSYNKCAFGQGWFQIGTSAVGNARHCMFGGYWLSTAAIVNLRLYGGNSNLTAGSGAILKVLP